MNEAALLATRRGAESVTLDDFMRAIERIVGGLEKKNRLLNPKEREVVAFHEIGHARCDVAARRLLEKEALVEDDLRALVGQPTQGASVRDADGNDPVQTKPDTEGEFLMSLHVTTLIVDLTA